MGYRRGGRSKGTPNKVTKDVRQTFAAFVDSGSDEFMLWLRKVADGVKETYIDDQGVERERYVIQPNPARAFDMVMQAAEYTTPKLARLEHSGNDENPVVIEHNVDVFGQLLQNLKMSRQAKE